MPHTFFSTSEGSVDAATVISNNSDLAFPIRQARAGVPVGLVNPTKGYPAGSPNGDPSDGVGGQWWHQLTVGDLQAAQLPSTVGELRKPAGW